MAKKTAKKKPVKKPAVKKDVKASNPGEVYTVRQVADLEGVGPFTVRAWINDGKIKAIKDEGGRYVIPKATYKRPATQPEASKNFWGEYRKTEGLPPLQPGQTRGKAKRDLPKGKKKAASKKAKGAAVVGAAKAAKKKARPKKRVAKKKAPAK